MNRVNKVCKNDWINVLSGIAIIMIYLVHSTQKLDGINSAVYRMSSFGSYGCQIFFFLSGFKLSISYAKKQTGYLDFLKRRYNRVAPGYILAVVVWLAITFSLSNFRLPYGFEQNHHMSAIILNVLLLNGLFGWGLNDVVPGGWLIGTLVLMYWLFPFLYKMATKLRKSILLVSPFVVLIITHVLALICEKHMHYFNYGEYGILGQLFFFYAGIVYFVLKDEEEESTLKLIMAIIVLFSALVLKVKNSFMEDLVGPILTLIILLAVIYILRSVCDVHLFSRVLDILEKFGNNSMEIYYIHFFVVWYITPLLYAFISQKINIDITLWWLACLVLELPIILGISVLWNRCKSAIGKTMFRL